MTKVWWETYSNVVELATWLVEHEKFNKASELLTFLEKPWKWTSDWSLMKAEKKAVITEATT